MSTDVERLINFLQTQLTMGSPEKYKLKILHWFPPVTLLKTYLQNNVKQFLITVRTYNGYTSRKTNNRPLRDTEFFEIATWTLESPDYKEPYKNIARDELVNQIKSVIKQDPILATVETYHNLDKMIGQNYVLNTTILVSILHEP
jgi:hypothetical protein